MAFHPRFLLSASILALTLPSASANPVFPEGDPASGKTLFEAQRCNRCHSVSGAGFAEEDIPSRPRVHLGEEHHAAWTRDDFARAIMVPSHSMNPDYERMARAVGDLEAATQSPMPLAVDALTVRQLTDIVTFLTAARP